MLEEWYPTIKYIAMVDNDGANALSQLDILDKLEDQINQEKSFPKLLYSDRKMKEVDQNVNIIMYTMMSQCDFEVDEFNGEYLYQNAAEQEFADSQLPLFVYTMK